MATTATITENSPQGGIRRRVYVRYDHDGGAVGTRGPMLLPMDADVQTIADSFIPKYDASFEETEKKQALSKFFDGEDMDVLFDAAFFKILTRNDVRRTCVRRASNRMVRGNQAAIEDLANCATWVNTLTNPVLAALLTNPRSTWSNAEAGDFKAALLALSTARESVDHGKGKQEE